MRGILVALAFGLIGCAADGSADDAEAESYEIHALRDEGPRRRATACDGSFRIDEGFTAAQRSSIARAADRWNAFLGYPFFSVDAEGACSIRVAALDWVDEAIFDEDARELLVNLASMRSSDRASGPRFETVILHELGHSIGMRHVSGARAVMAPSETTVAEDFTEADVAECERVGLCR